MEVQKIFLLLNFLLLAIGACGNPLLLRLYFARGGKTIWFASWLDTCAWPIIIIPLIISYTRRRRKNPTTAGNLFSMNLNMLFPAALIGTLTGLSDYLYTYGLSKLPVSTSSIIVATQLGFTAGFSFLIVRHRFTGYSVNAVVLLTVGAAVLGVHGGGSNRPEGDENEGYYLGFALTVGAAALGGLILPLVELTYSKWGRGLSYTMVLEMQLVMCLFANGFCSVGMIMDKGFKAIGKESKEYELGEAKYYWIAVWIAITCQSFILGAIGVVFYSSALVSGVAIAVLLPVTELLAVIFYDEKFKPEKGVSLFLSLWGFISYFYGEIKQMKKETKSSSDGCSVLEAQLTIQQAV